MINPLNRPPSADPMLAMIAASYQSTQLGLTELDDLATDQKAANDREQRVHAVSDKIRSILGAGVVHQHDLDELTQEAQSAGIDLSAELASAEQLIAKDNPGKASSPDEAANIPQGDAQPERQQIFKGMNDKISDDLEDLKSDASNRELDIQRISQEVSNGMQLQSNLSKRWSDVGSQIIANLRA